MLAFPRYQINEGEVHWSNQRYQLAYITMQDVNLYHSSVNEWHFLLYPFIIYNHFTQFSITDLVLWPKDASKGFGWQYLLISYIYDFFFNSSMDFFTVILNSDNAIFSLYFSAKNGCFFYKQYNMVDRRFSWFPWWIFMNDEFHDKHSRGQ